MGVKDQGWGQVIVDCLRGVMRFSGLEFFGRLLGGAWMVQQVFGFVRRAFLVAETAVHVYPDPFSHVRKRCARLKLSRTIAPRKMTLVGPAQNALGRIHPL